MKKLAKGGMWLALIGASGFALGYVWPMLRTYSHFFIIAVIAGVGIWIIGEVFL